ncbi:hypothetical protein [Bartonella bovis]|uniref:hypothetical protein n=1 Tax=Bartonella bovis TaxID=155194 RepID=UPI0003B43367|nr:hypothetical protein [Bartonella bovis]
MIKDFMIFVPVSFTAVFLFYGIEKVLRKTRFSIYLDKLKKHWPKEKPPLYVIVYFSVFFWLTIFKK